MSKSPLLLLLLLLLRNGTITVTHNLFPPQMGPKRPQSAERKEGRGTKLVCLPLVLPSPPPPPSTANYLLLLLLLLSCTTPKCTQLGYPYYSPLRFAVALGSGWAQGGVSRSCFRGFSRCLCVVRDVLSLGCEKARGESVAWIHKTCVCVKLSFLPLSCLFLPSLLLL